LKGGGILWPWVWLGPGTTGEMPLDPLWERLCGFLERGESVVLATIVEHSGSTPRTAGSRMIVRSDGRISGTIGGGRLEAEVIADAVGLFATGGARVRSFDLGAGDIVDAMDMICGGRVTVFLEPVAADASNRRLFSEVLDCTAGARRCLLVARPEEEAGGPGVRRCLLDPTGKVWGDLPLPAKQLGELWRRAGTRRGALAVPLDDGKVYVSPICEADTVLLFGAGHVSREVARLCDTVGFRTVVVDDRPEFANKARFDRADDIRVVADWAHAFDGLTVAVDRYVVILTHGHRHDKTVLSQALRTPAGYIGMIGSQRKRDSIYAALLREGFSREDLDRVHCPIGLEIGAETPEEIAVSIVAELIGERAEAMRSP
jgi:xanthine dehydrogenase accessory factor